MKLATVGTLMLFSSLLAAPALAQQWPTTDPGFTKPDPSLASGGAESFGAPGQMVISGDFDIDLQYVSRTLNNLSESGPSITISPSLLFFLAPNLALGGIVGFQHESRGDVSASAFTVGPLAGYNIWISPRASIFPMLGLQYSWRKQSIEIAGGRDSDSYQRFSLLLKAPVLFHPFPHVFVGFGPVIVIDFTSKVDDQDYAKTRSFGLTLDLGFYL
jgi:hypothetical protein